jgi:hypothetical protein
MEKTYPDISDLLEAKARRRRELAALAWEEKVEIVKQMQQLLPKGVWQISPMHKSSEQSLRNSTLSGTDAAGRVM